MMQTGHTTELQQTDTAALTPISSLATNHLVLLRTAIRNIFTTDLAFNTYAQIVDGLPTYATALQYHPDMYNTGFLGHLTTEPSSDAKQVVRSFRDNFSSDVLELDTKLLHQFQDAPLGSRQFNLHLMELVAIIFHELAARLYKVAEGGLRKDALPDVYVIDLPTPPPSSPKPWDHYEVPSQDEPDEPPPKQIRSERFKRETELFHPRYSAYDQYPKGVGDVVGYWAELQLFGGVVLFDRGPSGEESKDLFFEKTGAEYVYQVSEPQLNKMMEFLLCTKEQPCALPLVRFHAERRLRKYDWYTAMTENNIFRDRWEKYIPDRRPRACIRIADEEDAEEERRMLEQTMRRNRNEYQDLF